MAGRAACGNDHQSQQHHRCACVPTLGRSAAERQSAEDEREERRPDRHADVQGEAGVERSPDRVGRARRRRTSAAGAPTERAASRPSGHGRRTARRAGAAGSTTAGMNCTAWNSVDANALTKRPSAIPRIAFPIASTTTTQTGPTLWRSSERERDRRDERRLERGHEREGEAVAHEQVELRERQRHQPLERARRPLAQHRDRGDDEHRDEREQAEQRAADVLEDQLPAGEELVQQDDQERRDAEHQPDGARVAAKLGEHARRDGTGRRAGSLRVASSISRRKASSRSRAPVRARARRACPAASRLPSRSSSELVAALGLVHDVARDEHRRFPLRELGGTCPRALAAAAGRARRSARRGRATPARRAARSRARPVHAARPRAGYHAVGRARADPRSRAPTRSGSEGAPSTRAK